MPNLAGAALNRAHALSWHSRFKELDEELEIHESI